MEIFGCNADESLVNSATPDGTPVRWENLDSNNISFGKMITPYVLLSNPTHPLIDANRKKKEFYLQIDVYKNDSDEHP